MDPPLEDPDHDLSVLELADDPRTLKLCLSDLRRRLINARSLILSQRAALAEANEKVPPPTSFEG